MARKCDSEKFKKRRRKEIENRNENHRDQTAREAEWDRQRRENERKKREYEEYLWLCKLNDPRRPYAQAIVNVLGNYLRHNPLYQMALVEEALGFQGGAMGFSVRDLIEGSIKFDLKIVEEV